MARGSMLIQIQRPTLSPANTKRFNSALRAHCERYGLSPACDSWVDILDLPEDASGLHLFVTSRLNSTSIDMSHVTYEAMSNSMVYCITSSEIITCYPTVTPIWSGAGANPFVVGVKLESGEEAAYPLTFVVAIDARMG